MSEASATTPITRVVSHCDGAGSDHPGFQSKFRGMTAATEADRALDATSLRT